MDYTPRRIIEYQTKLSEKAHEYEGKKKRQNGQISRLPAKLTCKLTTPELQQRKCTVIAELKNLVKERKEDTNAVRYKFESSDKNIDLVSSFIKTERLCCDFFVFSLQVESGSEFIWLTLSGPEGVKAFIKEEVGF